MVACGGGSHQLRFPRCSTNVPHGRYRAESRKPAGMRCAHLARSCRGGLKLRFARRPMAAQGLRPPPDGLGRLLRSMGKLGK